MKRQFSELAKFSKKLRHAAMQAAVRMYTKMSDLPKEVLDQIAKLDETLPIVFVLYYGGTIGMVKFKELQAQFTQEIYVPSNDADKLFKPLRAKGLNKEVQLVWIPVYGDAIDSINGRWPHWVSLANVIRLLYTRALNSKGGFVICGGTDTMAEMLASMDLMFPNIGLPIIGTGAQVPMVKLGDDGTNNLYMAMRAAISDLKGSYLMFCNKLLHGGYVHKVQDRDRDAFSCAAKYVIGRFTTDLELLSHRKRDEIITEERLEFLPHFRECINIQQVSPAAPSESLLWAAMDPTCDVMLLTTLGTGNARDKTIVQNELTHIDCLRMFYEHRYPVVLGSSMIDGEISPHYVGGALALSKGPGGGHAISGGDSTGPRLRVKCMHAAGSAWDEKKNKLDYDRFVEYWEN